MAIAADLAALPEDDRITLIGETASAGQSTGFILENDAPKIARYIAKLKARFPDVKVENLGKFTRGSIAFRATRVQN